jgi:hypothetical protein
MVRRLAVAASAAFLAAACATAPEDPAPKAASLDEKTVRDFAASERAAWVAHDYDLYYALCAPDALFVSVRWNPDGTITREHRTPREDRDQAEHFFAVNPGKFDETDVIDNIQIAPDGLSAKITGHQTAHIDGSPGVVLRASTEETIVVREGRVRSMGQTDTAVR